MQDIKKLLIVFTILMVQIFILANATSRTYASESINNQIKLKIGKVLPKYYLYKEYPIDTKHILFDDIIEGNRPAYCLNAERTGVTEENMYNVTINGYVSDTDKGLWRLLINAYPYVSYTSLECNNNNEAFAATQQAIYVYLQQNDLERYRPRGDEGKRVLNAMNKILSNAENSSEEKLPKDIEIKEENENWEEDLSSEFAYKCYYVSAQAEFNKYNVNIEGLPEGGKIVDINGNEKQEFNANEEFKIIVPIKSVEDKLSLKINVDTQVKTKPIYYGKAPNDTLQDYALAKEFEESKATLEDNYSKSTKEKTVTTVEKESEKVLPLTGM